MTLFDPARAAAVLGRGRESAALFSRSSGAGSREALSLAAP